MRDLLIVPYGIETQKNWKGYCCLELLIVPYGIETWVKATRRMIRIRLLIVPYGIETSKSLTLLAVP